ncbi:MAG: type II toxin-antitoxin system VapC family toxin [Acidobacteria bacterium]|nr:type II toxin-antitoxin system VapC family toxin [Acidobacteriota bacterium]
MKLLLDTHTFIWWDSQPGNLSAKALEFCKDKTNTLIVSVASIWEMQIKAQLGNLTLNMPLAEIIESQRQNNKIQILPVEIEHVLAINQLPLHHKDPFDRILIAQALTENVTLLSKDPEFSKYPVTVIW